jgi:hypothetical protein
VTPAALFALLAQGVVIALAWVQTSRRAEHRPFAAFVTAMLVGDLARWLIIYTCPWISTPGPFPGAHRAIFAWPAALAACCWAIFLGRRPYAPLLAGAGAVALMIIGYPTPLRGALLGRFYAALHAASLLASGGAVVSWMRGRTAPRAEHACALLYVLLDAAYFAGPYLLPEPWIAWATADLIAVSEWCALVLLHVAALWGGFLTPSDRAKARRQ